MVIIANFDQDLVCTYVRVGDLLVTKTPSLVEIPSKSTVKSLSVLYYRLVPRIAESGFES